MARISRIESVDGLRAIAMTMVVAYHCGLLPGGWTGVWLFYVISGFVISRNFLAEREAGASPLRHYLSFIVRRVFRIVPPYFAYISICAAIAFALGLSAKLFEVPYLLLFVENWFKLFHLKETAEQSLSAFGHLWTISVEEQFYLLFPLIFFSLQKRRSFLIAVAILIACGPIIRFALTQVFTSNGMPDDQVAFGVYYSSVGQFDAFLAGVVLAINERRIRDWPQVSRRLLLLALNAIVLFIAIYAIVNYQSWHARGPRIFDRMLTGLLYGQGRELVVYSAIDLVAATIVAHAIAGKLGWLSGSVLTYVGRISYGGYLYHALVIQILCQYLGVGLLTEVSIPIRFVALVVTMTASLACAFVSYEVLERQMLSVGHRLGKRLLAVSPAPAA